MEKYSVKEEKVDGVIKIHERFYLIEVSEMDGVDIDHVHEIFDNPINHTYDRVYINTELGASYSGYYDLSLVGVRNETDKEVTKRKEKNKKKRAKNKRNKDKATADRLKQYEKLKKEFE